MRSARPLGRRQSRVPTASRIAAGARIPPSGGFATRAFRRGGSTSRASPRPSPRACASRCRICAGTKPVPLRAPRRRPSTATPLRRRCRRRQPPLPSAARGCRAHGLAPAIARAVSRHEKAPTTLSVGACGRNSGSVAAVGAEDVSMGSPEARLVRSGRRSLSPSGFHPPSGCPFPLGLAAAARLNEKRPARRRAKVRKFSVIGRCWVDRQNRGGGGVPPCSPSPDPADLRARPAGLRYSRVRCCVPKMRVRMPKQPH